MNHEVLRHRPVDDKAVYSRSEGRGLEAIDHADCRRMAEYWNGLRDGNGVPPSRARIDPLAIPWALSRLFLADYALPREECHYRLVGDHLEEMVRRVLGHNTMKGVTLETMVRAALVPVVRQRWRPLAEKGDIIYMTGPIYTASTGHALGARVMLPLVEEPGGAGGGKVTGFVGYTDCAWVDTTERTTEPLHICYIPLSEIA
jgi:hypothetical protein